MKGLDGFNHFSELDDSILHHKVENYSRWKTPKIHGNYRGLLLRETDYVVLGQPLADEVISSSVLGEFKSEHHITEGGKNLLPSEWFDLTH